MLYNKYKTLSHIYYNVQYNTSLINLNKIYNNDHFNYMIIMLALLSHNNNNK